MRCTTFAISIFTVTFPTGLLSTVSTSTTSGSTAAAGFTPATIKFPTSTVLVQTLPPLLQTSTSSTISTTGILVASFLLVFFYRLSVPSAFRNYFKIEEN